MPGPDSFDRILVLLYGSLEFDGRVRRMLDVLTGLGKVVLVDVADGRAAAAGIAAGDRLQRISVCLRANGSLVRRHLSVWMAAYRIAREVRPDLVVGEDYFTAFPAWFIGRRFRARVVYDAHELIIPCAGVRRSPRNLFWYCLERWVARRADLVIAANLQRARFMQQHYRLGNTPAVLRNIPPAQGAAGSREDSVGTFPALKRQASDDRIIIYQGDVRLARGIGRFIEALRFLPASYRLVIAGDGPDASSLARSQEHLIRAGRLAMLGMVPNDRLRSVAACADAGIVTYPYVGLNNIFCAPNKLFEYAQAGLPVIATDQPPLAEALQQYRIGALVGRDDGPETIARTIRTVVDSRETYRAGLSEFLRANTWEDEAARIVARISHLGTSSTS